MNDFTVDLKGSKQTVELAAQVIYSHFNVVYASKILPGTQKDEWTCTMTAKLCGKQIVMAKRLSCRGSSKTTR